MKSKWSLFLGKIFGIGIYVHWTFVILLLWIAMSGFMQGQNIGQIGFTTIFILAIFLCVTLHELGHAVVAKRYDCPTKRIMLLPIGGVAQMERLPEVPSQEVKVAIAGPAVNVVIAGILYITSIYRADMEQLLKIQEINAQTFLLNLFRVNVLLVAFNLIPAFPMDGGRVLRALLSFRMPRHQATRIAAYIGQFIAILFVFLGFFYNPFLMFIGVFIFLGAQMESEFYQSRFLLSGYKVGDVVMHEYHSLKADEPLSNAVKTLLDVQAKSFLVMEDGHVGGILDRNRIIEALSNHGTTVSIGEIMDKDIRWLDAGQSLEDVYSTMRMNASTLFPVKEDGSLKGVLDMENVMEFLLVQKAEGEFERNHVRN